VTHEQGFSSEMQKTRVRIVARFRPLNEMEMALSTANHVTFDEIDDNLVRINEIGAPSLKFKFD
jgi:hypothetical protein